METQQLAQYTFPMDSSCDIESLDNVSCQLGNKLDPLAPYLAGLNLTDAVESFAQLADRLIESDSFQESSSACSPLSNPSSPASSDFRSPATTPGYSSYCSGSSGPSSVASSFAHHDSTHYKRSSSSASSTSSFSSSTGRLPEKRKRKNANAAERYRRKLKGRKCNLFEQIEQEEARQQSLRRQIESKLNLYKEFVELLARNTGSQDEELAVIGERSLLNVLRLVHPSDEQDSCELWSYLEHFRSVSDASATSSSESTSTTAVDLAMSDNELVYDFYADQWIQQQQQQQQQQQEQQSTDTEMQTIVRAAC